MSEWRPPITPTRPDGFECLIWHRGRWRHVKWVESMKGWMFGYGSAMTIDTRDRLYAPLPEGTPDVNFWDGEES